MVGIRVEGKAEDIKEILKRLPHVMFVSHVSKHYPSQKAEQFLVYLRAYIYDADTLLDQLIATQQERDELLIEREQLSQQVYALKEQLRHR